MTGRAHRITRRVYRVQPGPHFQRLWLDIPKSEYRAIGNSAGGAWRAPPAYIENPLLPRADFIASKDFGLACPLSLLRAWPQIGIDRDCDIHPFRISGESQEYVLFRPKRVLAEDAALEGAVEGSFLFRPAEWSNEICATVVDGPGAASDDFLRFTKSFTGLELQLVGEASR